MPLRHVKLLEAYCSSTQARVCAYGKEHADFLLDSGFRQGCPISPTLPNYSIDWIVRCARNNFRGMQLGRGYRVTDHEFAKDIVLLRENPETP